MVTPIDRRSFLQKAGLGSLALASGVGLSSCYSGPKGLVLPDMRLYWQKHKTKRPFSPDVDKKGRIWYGREELYRSDIHTNTTKRINSEAMNGLPISTTLCSGDKVYMLAQKSPHLHIYDPQKDQFSTADLPDSESNIWFGNRIENDPRLYFYVRNRGHLTVWDTEMNKGKMIPYPDGTDLWSGHYNPVEEALYCFPLDAKPVHIFRFDLKKQRFDPGVLCPEPALEITGVNAIGDTLWCSDRFTARLFPYNWVNRVWGKPVTAPGLGTEFGFTGMGCSYKGLALYCLSSYNGAMIYDFDTNTYHAKPDDDIGIDGLPHHFLNKYLAFHPESGEFAFLEAKAEEGSYPLICYSMVHEDKLIITGFNAWNAQKGYADIETEGELLVFHN
jgi:hypothetical protein